MNDQQKTIATMQRDLEGARVARDVYKEHADRMHSAIVDAEEALRTAIEQLEDARNLLQLSIE